MTPATLKLSPGDHDLELRDAETGAVLATRSVRAVAGRAARINFKVKKADRSPPKPAIAVIEAPIKAPVTEMPDRVDMIGAPSSAAGTQDDGGRVDIIGQ